MSIVKMNFFCEIFKKSSISAEMFINFDDFYLTNVMRNVKIYKTVI